MVTTVHDKERGVDDDRLHNFAGVGEVHSMIKKFVAPRTSAHPFKYVVQYILDRAAVAFHGAKP